MRSDTFKENRANINAAIIIGILLFYSQPFLSLMRDKVINGLINASDTFSCFYYMAVGKNISSNINWSTNYLVLISLATSLLVLLVIIRKEMTNAIRKTNNLAKEINGNNDHHAPEDPEVLKSKMNDLREEVKKVNKELVTTKKIAMPILYILASFLILSFFLVFEFTSSVNMKNLHFEQSLTIIAPEVEDHEIKLLKAEWLQIESRVDFNRITSKIDSIQMAIKN